MIRKRWRSIWYCRLNEEIHKYLPLRLGKRRAMQLALLRVKLRVVKPALQRVK